MRFSQRIGQRPIKTILQIEAIDSELQNRLWNTVLESFIGQLSNTSYVGNETSLGEMCIVIWKDFFGKTIDTVPRHGRGGIVDTYEVLGFLRKWFFDAPWYEVYDLLEFLARIDMQSLGGDFTEDCNKALKQEVAGYRIIDGNVVQITAEEEVLEVEEAFFNTENLRAVSIHLKAALDMLANRKQSDYRNSIKESISAVEAFCKIITGDGSATLGKALNEIEKTHKLHGALKTAFSALYGYTSDAAGIRHALVDTSTELEFEDAKFMLVSCSAFINYLKTKFIN